MKESQNTEFKRIWKDEYLRHICAFANSRGGSLLIGVLDDGTEEALIKSSKVFLMQENLIRFSKS